MKIAIIIAGFIRSFDHIINQFQKNVLQNYDIDIYIHYWKQIK